MLVGLVVLIAVGLYESAHRPSVVGRLPFLASRSLLRMIVAFVLSLAFALVFGHTAATNRRAAKVLLPVLDVLQSVPILGFFPAAVFFFVGLSHGSSWGLEAASVFLIFTSQNWNMTFGVYEGIIGIPRETLDAGDVFGLRGWSRLHRLILPATVPKLVYNGIVSWANGWYFVTASEIISTNQTPVSLPGLGSFLWEAAEAGDTRLIFLGLLTLVVLVLVVEFLVWRPLQVWAEQFRFENVPGATTPRSRALGFYRALVARPRNVRPARPPASAQPPPSSVRPRAPLRPRRGGAWVSNGVAAAFILLFSFVAAIVGTTLVRTLTRPLPQYTSSIPLAILVSGLRLLIAYIFAVAWTVPAAIGIARHPRLSVVVLPLTDVVASIPAVAFFPIIVLVLAGVTGGLEVPSLLLVLTGMQWYLLFNLIAGARSVPQDLLDAARLFGVKGLLLWRRVFLPAMAPAFVTGSITAWGGGWNALIVSEYVRFGTRTYSIFGIGNIIDRATFDQPTDPHLLLLAVAAMVVTIVLVNAVVWKPLYRRAVQRFRLEG